MLSFFLRHSVTIHIMPVRKKQMSSTCYVTKYFSYFLNITGYNFKMTTPPIHPYLLSPVHVHLIFIKTGVK